MFLADLTSYSFHLLVQEGKLISGDAGGAEQGINYLRVIFLQPGKQLKADSIPQR